MERERKVRAIVTVAMLVTAALMLGVLEGAIFLRHREEAAVSAPPLNLRWDDFPSAASRVPPCPAMGSDAATRSGYLAAGPSPLPTDEPPIVRSVR